MCCDDHTHCCPHDTVCNMEASTCDDPSSSGLSLPWVSKVPALTLARDTEKCDKETLCPGGTTCCQQNSGQWTCCPLPHVRIHHTCQTEHPCVCRICKSCAVTRPSLVTSHVFLVAWNFSCFHAFRKLNTFWLHKNPRHWNLLA